MALRLLRSVWSSMTNRPEASRFMVDETNREFVLRLLSNLPGMAYRCRIDPQWTMEFVSPGCRKLTGFAPQDLLDNRVVAYGTLVHPDDRDRVWESVQRGLAKGASFQLTYRIRRADGIERWVWEQGIGVRGASGELEAIEGFIMDITAHEEVVDRLAEKEGQYRALVEQSVVGVYVVRSGKLQYVNGRFAEIFGYSVEEILALPSTDALVHPEDRQLVAENLRMRLVGEVDVLRYEVRGLRKDGSVCEVEVHRRRVEVDDRPAVMGLLVDVTHRNRAQRRYRETKKMEALGELAAGVAHDFNNILSVIKTTGQIMLLERPEDADLARDLADIGDAVDRGVALSRQLMTFGGGRPSTVSQVSVARIIDALLPMLERILGDAIEVSVSLEPDLPTLEMDPSRLEEVLMNLVLNAGDAMPEGGSLAIEAHTREVDDGGEPSAYATVPHVVLQVTDTGAGMPPEVQRRLFEPYFTTKGEKGTGLGLANVWRIANDQGGTVTVTSELGRGSAFQVVLPTQHPAG